MPTQVKQEISIEDAQRALSQALGSGYRVHSTSDSTLRVVRNPVIWASVRMSWSGGTTTFHVRPGGFLLVMLLNMAYTVPKVQRALERSFAAAS